MVKQQCKKRDIIVVQNQDEKRKRYIQTYHFQQRRQRWRSSGFWKRLRNLFFTCYADLVQLSSSFAFFFFFFFCPFVPGNNSTGGGSSFIFKNFDSSMNYYEISRSTCKTRNAKRIQIIDAPNLIKLGINFQIGRSRGKKKIERFCKRPLTCFYIYIKTTYYIFLLESNFFF